MGERGLAATGLALAAMLTFAVPEAVRGQDQSAAVADPAGFEELLVELRMGRRTVRTVLALTDGEAVLVSAGDFLGLGEVEHTVDPSGTVRAVLHPGGRALVVDPAQGRASLDGAPVSLPPRSVARRDDGTYLATAVLEEILAVSLRVDWVQLTVTVADVDALPVGRRLDREARWAVVTGTDDSRDPGMPLDLAQATLGGAVLDWRLASNLDDMSGSGAYAVGAGARAFGGALQLSARSIGPATQGEHRIDATYQKVFRDLAWLTQMRLGDGFATGPRYRSMRGISLTNAPFVRRSFFGVDSFSGRVGPGWDVELRQAGRSVDVTRADEQGAFALDIPLRYGENVVEVVAFGPHGEVVTAERLLLLGIDRLTGGALEWGLSGGGCRDERCEGTGNLDVRYGVSDAWTVRGGLETFRRDTLPSLVQPYAGLSGAVGPSLLLSAEAVHAGFLRGGLAFAPSPRLRVRVAHTAFSKTVGVPVLQDASRERTTEADVLFRPLAHEPSWLFRGSVIRQDFDFGTMSRIQASSTFRVGRAGVEAGIRREVDAFDVGGRSSRDYQFASFTGLLRLPGGRSVWARSDVEFLEASHLDRVRARVAYQLSRAVRLEVGGGWRRSLGSDLTVTFSADLAELRNLTQLVATEGFPARITQVSQGTVHWNEATRQLGFSQGPGLERGGLSGYVFVDENGNGMRDPEESGLDGVRVVIGGRTVRTDADGRHGAWDLVPFEAVRVWADSASIADPFLVPLRDEVEVLVPPSSFGRVDIPLTPSRELTGRVVRVTPDGEVPVPYAALELVDLESDRVRRVRAFSDGAIYEIGVKPGRYELRIDPEWLRSTDLRPEAGRRILEIEAGSAAPAPDPVIIRLVSGREDGER